MTDCAFLYQTDNGKLFQFMSPPPVLHDHLIPSGMEMVIFESGDDLQLETDYFLDGKLEPRPSMPLTGGGSVAVGELWRIDGIPAGTEVSYPGGSVVVDDGFIELDFAESGEYVFRFSNFPYLEEQRIATIADS